MIENDYIESDYYVSFDAVFRAIDEYDDYVIDDETGEWYIPISKALSLIENISPADVRPVVRGKWIPGERNCPVCGESKFKNLDADVWADWMPPYCPHCGADMRGK